MSLPSLSRRESSEWMAGRSGARPIPPATTTTSTPCSCSVGQGRPKGPRTDSRWPTDASQIACVAIPTARTVWTSGPGRSGSPLIEIGTSPVPKAEIIVN